VSTSTGWWRRRSTSRRGLPRGQLPVYARRRHGQRGQTRESCWASTLPCLRPKCATKA
jgi:hypothetical protein